MIQPYYKTELSTIYHEDCFDVMKHIKDKSVDLIVSDVPYGINFVSGYRNIKHKKILNDNNLEWLSSFVSESYRLLKDNTHLYCFCSFHNVDIFKQELQRKFKVKNILVWEKNNHGSGDLKGDYAPQYEFIIYCQKGERKLNGNRDSNIIKFQKTDNKLHPTQKPVDLIKYLINKSSNKHELVLDMFHGSGTTSIACEQSNRRCIGIECDEQYCKINVERLKCIQQELF